MRGVYAMSRKKNIIAIAAAIILLTGVIALVALLTGGNNSEVQPGKEYGETGIDAGEPSGNGTEAAQGQPGGSSGQNAVENSAVNFKSKELEMYVRDVIDRSEGEITA